MVDVKTLKVAFGETKGKYEGYCYWADEPEDKKIVATVALNAINMSPDLKKRFEKLVVELVSTALTDAGASILDAHATDQSVQSAYDEASK